MILQLILIDDKTKQPQKVELIEEGYLDIKSPLQRTLYLNTIQHLTPLSEVYSVDKGEVIEIHLDKLTEGTITAPVIEVYTPEDEEEQTLEEVLSTLEEED
jgi:hypothetical protein